MGNRFVLTIQNKFTREVLRSTLTELFRLTSLMSENEDIIFETVADYIQAQTGIPVRVINQIDWKERERLLNSGQIDIAWICGLPYILRADQPDSGIELLAAPVISGKRYQNKPIYFSDVVVHRDSRFHTFADLKDASWAYNEPNSHSGYNVVRYHLATLGETGHYFSKVIESGAHLNSLQMILRKEVDASAIDSIVLEMEFHRHPEMRSKLRIIETLGPSPVPPFVISTKLPLETREFLRDLLIKMDTSLSGQAILSQIRMVRLARINDPDYDAIRYMYQKGKGLTLQPGPI